MDKKYLRWTVVEAPFASKISRNLFLLFKGYRAPILAQTWKWVIG